MAIKKQRKWNALITPLEQKSYNPGRIDGVIGQEIMSAMKKYQRDSRLSEGQLIIQSYFPTLLKSVPTFSPNDLSRPNSLIRASTAC